MKLGWSWGEAGVKLESSRGQTGVKLGSRAVPCQVGERNEVGQEGVETLQVERRLDQTTGRVPQALAVIALSQEGR